MVMDDRIRDRHPPIFAIQHRARLHHFLFQRRSRHERLHRRTRLVGISQRPISPAIRRESSHGIRIETGANRQREHSAGLRVEHDDGT